MFATYAILTAYSARSSRRPTAPLATKAELGNGWFGTPLLRLPDATITAPTMPTTTDIPTSTLVNILPLLPISSVRLAAQPVALAMITLEERFALFAFQQPI